MKSTKEVESNLSRDKRINDAADRDPERSQDENQSLAIDICYTSPKQQKTTKGQDIGRDDPL